MDSRKTSQKGKKMKTHITLMELLMKKTDQRSISFRRSQKGRSQSRPCLASFCLRLFDAESGSAEENVADSRPGANCLEVNKTKRQNSPTLKNSQKFVRWGQWFNTRSISEKVINFEITDFSMYGDFLPKIDASFL